MGRRETYAERIHRLKQNYAGVEDPRQMGTTGLIGWVLTGPGRTWDRCRRAVTILRARRKHLIGFARAVLLEETNHAARAQLTGYFRTLLRSDF